MTVDSFKYLPRLIAAFYQMTERQLQLPIPWTPLPKPLSACTFGLVTSGGLYVPGQEPPFDLEREKLEPAWGDPTFRTIPAGVRQAELGVSHLHFNPQAALVDFNVLLPLERFAELAAERRIGALASEAYSFMGYQGYTPNPHAWQTTYGPQVAERLKAQGADCALLVPA